MDDLDRVDDFRRRGVLQKEAGCSGLQRAQDELVGVERREDDDGGRAGPDRLIATMKDHKQRAAARDLGQTTGPPPEGSTLAEAMEHRLRTPEGTAAYAQRSHTIEPIFADRKHNRRMRSFRRRGLDAANSEWAFMNLAQNMLKLRHHRTAAAAAPPAPLPARSRAPKRVDPCRADTQTATPRYPATPPPRTAPTFRDSLSGTKKPPRMRGFSRSG